MAFATISEDAPVDDQVMPHPPQTKPQSKYAQAKVVQERKRTDGFFSVVFHVAFWTHLLFGVLILNASNTYRPKPSNVSPESCDPGACFWESKNKCGFGEAKWRHISLNTTSECLRPCETGKIYYSNHCLDVDKVDESALKGCFVADKLYQKLIEEAEAKRRQHQQQYQQIALPTPAPTEAYKSEKTTLDEAFAKVMGETVLLCVVLLVDAICWGYILKQHTLVVVWSTICCVNVTLFVLTGWYLSQFEVDFIALVLICLTIAFVAFPFFAYKKIKLSAMLMKQACQAVQEEKSILVYGFLLKMLWVAYAFFCFSVLIESSKIYRLHRISSHCVLQHESWIILALVFIFFVFLWTTSLFLQLRFGMVSGAVSMWYFHYKSQDSSFANPTLEALKWSVTKSFGSHCFSALVLGFTDRLTTTVLWAKENKWFLYSNPLGWFCFLCDFLWHDCMEILTRYTTVMHILTGESLCKSGKKVNHMLRKHYAASITQITVGDLLLTLATTMITLAMIWMSVLVYSSALNSYFSQDAFDHLWAMSRTIVGVTLAVSCFPYLFAVVVGGAVLKGLLEDDDVFVDQEHAAMYLSLFVGLCAHVLFQFMASTLLHSLTTVFVCYAVAKDNQIAFDHTCDIESLIDSVLSKNKEQKPTSL